MPVIRLVAPGPDGRLAGHTRVSIGGVPRILFGTDQYMTDTGAGQGVVKRADRCARIAEDGFHTLRFETTDHRFTDGCNHGQHLLV